MPPSDTALPAGPRAENQARPLHEVLRRAVRADAGRAALRVRVSGGPDSAPRLLRHLLEDAARGGPVFALSGGDWLLPEADEGAADRAASGIEALFAGRAEALEITRWRLPDEAAALLALAVEAVEPTAPPLQPSPSAAGLEALIDALDLVPLLRLNPMMHVKQGGSALGYLRLGVSNVALAAAMGGMGGDADLLRHARDRLARRLLTTLADEGSRRTLLGAGASQRVLVELSPAALPAADESEETTVPQRNAEAPRMLAALPLSVAADPALLARRRAALAARGWGLALRGLTHEALGWIAPETLQADLLMLRWSPALIRRSVVTALRRLDPDRIALIGCESEEALQWGLSRGIRHYGGSGPELVLTAARMAACPDRSGCTRRQCLRRAASATAAGRDGCTQPALLAAALETTVGTA